MYDPERGYPRVVPYVLYDDPAAAAVWLSEVLDLREVLRFTSPDGAVPHVELLAGEQIVMLGQAGGRFGTVASITLVFVVDVRSTCKRAVEAGGTVMLEPTEQPWGLRQAVVADPEGQRWEISEHLRDAPAEEWGATQTAPMPG